MADTLSAAAQSMQESNCSEGTGAGQGANRKNGMAAV
jgi:hypothetical protein